MMFKNAVFYRIQDRGAAVAEMVPFAPCGPAQRLSAGWTPPRGEEGGALVEHIGGHRIMVATIQTRTVPGAALRKRVDEMAEMIERDTGRKPGKKERRELTANAELDLLPHAFPKTAKVPVWVDPAAGLVVIDTGSMSAADIVVTLLGLPLVPVNANMAPATLMTCWLRDGSPDVEEFDLGDECELRNHETKATVRHAKCGLDTAEVKAHVTAGLRATRLGLEWKGKVSLTLTDGMTLRKIEFLDVQPGEFDADVAIMTGTLAPLIADLIVALDGEVQSD